MFLNLPRTYWYLLIGTLINRLGAFVLPFLTLYLTGERAISPSRAALVVAMFGAGSFVAQLSNGRPSVRSRRGQGPAPSKIDYFNEVTNE